MPMTCKDTILVNECVLLEDVCEEISEEDLLMYNTAGIKVFLRTERNTNDYYQYYFIGPVDALRNAIKAFHQQEDDTDEEAFGLDKQANDGSYEWLGEQYPTLRIRY
jgi:hypothetical protein